MMIEAMSVEQQVANGKRRTAQIQHSPRVVCRSLLGAYCSLCCLLFLAGCKNSYQLETAPVRGKITIDGKPLQTGKVRFAPERGRGATGDIQPDGTYKLTTYSPDDGAIVGKHRVSIEARRDAGKRSVENEEPVPPSLIPEYYADESKSGLEFDVKSGETNKADFSLRSR